MKFYKDITLKESVDYLDFGEVEISRTKELALYVLNDSPHKIKHLEFTAGPEVQVLQAPEELKSEEMGVLKVKWVPNIKNKKALNTDIQVKGVEIYE